MNRVSQFFLAQTRNHKHLLKSFTLARNQLKTPSNWHRNLNLHLGHIRSRPPDDRRGDGLNAVYPGELLQDGNETREMGGMVPDDSAGRGVAHIVKKK